MRTTTVVWECDGCGATAETTSKFGSVPDRWSTVEMLIAGIDGHRPTSVRRHLCPDCTRQALSGALHRHASPSALAPCAVDRPDSAGANGDGGDAAGTFRGALPAAPAVSHLATPPSPCTAERVDNSRHEAAATAGADPAIGAILP